MKYGIVFLGCSLLLAQSINLGTQSHNADFSNLAVTKPVAVGTFNPATCIIGQLFFNTAAIPGQNLFGCTALNTWTVLYNSTSSSSPVVNEFPFVFNIKDWGAKGDGATDDTAAINSFLTFINTHPSATAYIPAGKYLMAGSIITGSSIKWQGDGFQQSCFVETLATADLFIMHGGTANVAGWNPGPSLSNICLGGEGSATTGNLLVLNTSGDVHVDNVGFYGTAGVGIMLATERAVITNIHFQAVKRALATDPGSAINEDIIDHFTIMSPGTSENDLQVGTPNGSYSYSINSSGGNFPTSGALVEDQHAAMDFNGNVDKLYIGHGSIKPTLSSAGIRIRASYSSVIDSVYIEGFNNGANNPGIIYGGGHEKTTLTNSISASALVFDVNDGQWFSYYSNPSDLQTGGAVWVLRPPDFLQGSTDPSTLGNGITRGTYEYIGYSGMVHDPTGSRWHPHLTSRGNNGTTAVAWPGGTIFEDGWGSAVDPATVPFPNALVLENNHLNSVNSSNTFSYSQVCDNTNEKPCGEIVLGIEPDLFFTPGSSRTKDQAYMMKFDGNNRFGCGWGTAGNIDTYASVLLDLNGSAGSGMLGDVGGIPTSTASLTGTLTSACVMTRNVWGSNGTKFRYIDRGTSIYASGPTGFGWYGYTTDSNGTLTIANQGTPGLPLAGFVRVYAKGNQFCKLSSAGAETCF